MTLGLFTFPPGGLVAGYRVRKSRILACFFIRRFPSPASLLEIVRFSLEH